MTLWERNKTLSVWKESKLAVRWPQRCSLKLVAVGWIKSIKNANLVHFTHKVPQHGRQWRSFFSPIDLVACSDRRKMIQNFNKELLYKHHINKLVLKKSVDMRPGQSWVLAHDRPRSFVTFVCGVQNRIGTWLLNNFISKWCSKKHSSISF